MDRDFVATRRPTANACESISVAGSRSCLINRPRENAIYPGARFLLRSDLRKSATRLKKNATKKQKTKTEFRSNDVTVIKCLIQM